MPRMMPPTLPELLCPAGDEAALRAAVDCGANAVYLGYKAFGARASATNFDDEALARAVEYAHLYHARVHVTVNTLVKPAEVEGVRDALSAIANAGADAVIVQDLGVAEMVRREFPSLGLHASTQMAICGAEGARVARKLGFERVVLARECNLSTIRDVAATGIETEVFVHGALCTAVSGRCLMSSMAGGRSGNRGRCAQPCRQNFRFDDGSPAPLISMRDLCLWADLPALCEAGVASLKVEGRLKSAEYVAVVASVYRRALDDLAVGRFDPNDPAPREALLQVFNRGGFTRGHAMGAEDAALITPERVSHEGLPLGTVTHARRGVATVRLTRDLHDGDSLQLRGEGGGDFRYSGPDVAAGEVAALRLRSGLEARLGMSVSRLSDARQLEAARQHAPKPIPVSLLGCFAVGQPMKLSLSDGEVSVTVVGDVAEAARNRATTADEARKQLEKLGGTPFAAPQGAQVALDGACFLPVGALNALRREGVARLTEARVRAFARKARMQGLEATQGARGAAYDSPVASDCSLAGGHADARACEPRAGSARTTQPSAFDSPVASDCSLAGGHADAVRACELCAGSARTTQPSALDSPVASDCLHAGGYADARACELCAGSARMTQPSALDSPVASDCPLAGEYADVVRACNPRAEAPASSPIAATSPITPATLAVIFPDAALAGSLRESGADLLIYDPRDLRLPALRDALALLPSGVWLRLPPQAPDATLQALVELVNASALSGVVAESVGQLALPFRVPMLAGEGIPVTNPLAQTLLARTGVCGFTLWSEWTYAEQQALAPSLPCLVKVYGRETLMLLNHCPERARRGLISGRKACELCRSPEQVCARDNPCLTDRMGYCFPLTRVRYPDGCEIDVLNALPTSLASRDDERRALGAGALLHFTIETPQEQTRLVSAFRALMHDGTRVSIGEPTTAGHWLRGVE